MPLLVALTSLFLTITLLVVFRTSLLGLDQAVYDLRPAEHTRPIREWLLRYVLVGQRAPSTLVMLPWFVWKAWRGRSLRPLKLLAYALVTLNVLVGATKIVTGRVSPLRTSDAGDLFAGSDAFPSGHVANCVVLYGLVALLVAPPLRQLWIVLTCVIAASVGVAGVLLNMHWTTDIVGGWVAGGIVLALVAPFEAVVERSKRIWRRRR